MDSDKELNEQFESAFKRLQVNEPTTIMQNNNLFANNQVSLVSQSSNAVAPQNVLNGANQADKRMLAQQQQQPMQQMYRDQRNCAHRHRQPIHQQPQTANQPTPSGPNANVQSRCDHHTSTCKDHAQCSKSGEVAQNCSNQARKAEPDVTVDELAGYLDLQLYLPKKMSFMAELMYT